MSIIADVENNIYQSRVFLIFERVISRSGLISDGIVKVAQR